MLNRYFTSQMNLNDENRSLPQLPPDEHNLASIVITAEDVKDSLHNLNINKACGPYLITPHLLKEGTKTLALAFTIIIIMSQCIRFPTMWYVRPAKSQISLRIRAV